MKKIVSAILAGSVLLCLAACNTSVSELKMSAIRDGLLKGEKYDVPETINAEEVDKKIQETYQKLTNGN